MAREKDFRAISGFGHRTREAFVQITLGEEMTQVSPLKARQLAGMLLEAAEAAEGDALVMHFAGQVLGLDDRKAGQLLLRFREERRKRYERDREELEPVEPLGGG